MWGRLSPHPAFEDDERPPRAAHAHRAARILPARDDATGCPPRHTAPPDDSRRLSPAAQMSLAALRERGASFFADWRARTGRLASEVEDGCGNWSRRVW